ncbi:MAG: MarR family transcriptional regulator [Tessaracoccus sp.]
MINEDADRLSRVIVDLRRLQRTARKPLGDDEGEAQTLTLMEKEVLRCIAAHPGVGTSGIAEGLHLKANTVSGIVSRLVSKGYVSRSPHERDRRAARLTLTKEAQRDRSGHWEARADRVEAGLRHLSDAERAAIREALPALEALGNAMRRVRADT